MNDTKARNTSVGKKSPAVFSKEKLLNMRRFLNRRDLLSVLLRDGQTYTAAQAESLINEFMKGKVR